MFRPWKVLTAVCVLLYELVQVSQASYNQWLQADSRWWAVILATTIAFIAFVWSQVDVSLRARWRVVVSIFAVAIAIAILREGRVALLVSMFDEAFTGVAIACTLLYFSSTLRRLFE